MNDMRNNSLPAFVIQQGGTVLGRIYPLTDMCVEISREAAIHLYTLLQRYNATIGAPRWSGFWPRITQIERTMLVMFVKANCEGHFGRRLTITNLPHDFASITEETRRKPITETITAEFEALHECFVRSLVSEAEIRSAWESIYPEITALLKQHEQFDTLFESSRCYAADHVEQTVERIIAQYGRSLVKIPEGLDPATHFELCAKSEALMFAGVVRELVREKY